MAKRRVTRKRSVAKADDLASKAVSLCVGLDQHRRALLLQEYAWHGILRLAASCKVPQG